MPDWAATTCEPYGAAMSTARCPAWKYWLIEPPGTGHRSRPAAGAGTVLRDVGPLTAGHRADAVAARRAEWRWGRSATGVGSGLGRRAAGRAAPRSIWTEIVGRDGRQAVDRSAGDGRFGAAGADRGHDRRESGLSAGVRGGAAAALRLRDAGGRSECDEADD